MPRRILFTRCLLALGSLASLASTATAQTVTLNGVTFSNQGLVGVGRMPANLRDKFGETFGSFSGLCFDPRTWKRNADGTYSGTLYALPDRGYTKAGVTTNYRARFNQLAVSFTPAPAGAATQTQVGLTLTDTTLLTEADGTPLTSLDATGTGVRPGFPPLPQAYNGRLSLDGEGIALHPDGTFYISDEYGPYLYHFTADGKLLSAIRPPEAFIPKRGGLDSFSSNNAPAGQPAPSPSDPTTGRANNQGFEGLSLSPDGRTLYALNQSALRQDGGNGPSAQRRYTRLVAYDLSNPAAPALKGEWILPLPLYTTADGTTRVASQSDMLALNNRHFLLLCRDTNGRGGDNPTAVFRAVMLYDIAAATNLAGTSYDNPATPVAPGGVLAAGVTPATSALLIDLLDPAQIAKFGLTNGPIDSVNNLAEKWESLALVPALDPAAPGDYFLFVGNDNDFATSDGLQDGVAFRTTTTIDSMVLVYRLSLASRLVNISSRSFTGPGDAAHFVGFVVQGPKPRPFVVRGVGPALTAFGVAGALADPVLQIFDASGRVIATNDNWGDGTNLAELRAATGAVGAFALPEGSKDAALLVYLDPGAYSVQIAGANGATGISLAEVYEVP